MTIPGVIFDSVANFVRPPAAGFGMRLYGATSGSVGLKPAAVAGAIDYTLPAADGAADQSLVTSGAAVLSWATRVSSVAQTVPSFLSVAGSPIT